MKAKNLFNPKVTNGIPEISPEEFKPHVGKVTLIDVRNPDEFIGELSHIPGAKLVTLGSELDSFLQTQNKNEEMVFVCRSGGRSGRATLQARNQGFLNCINLQGGMLLWNERKYPVEEIN
jgi:rhodanese-related sulfurtransferase